MPAKPDRATAYAKAIKAGKVLAGQPVRLACERHLRDLKRKDLVWHRDRAERAIQFFSDILLLEDGRPFDLQPFQAFIVGSLFGWYTKAGDRRFRTAYCEIGKGNGKSPLAAGIGIYGIVADGEPAPEVYAAAVSHDQARIVFKDAARMVEESPELKALITSQVGSLTIPSQYATFRPVSSEHRSLDGLRVHMGLIDELHEHPSALVVDKIRAGTKSRKNALIFEITNSGYDRNSVCWKHHDYSIQILEGVAENDAWFAYVCSLDTGDSWIDESVWVKANPGLDVILPRRYLREHVEEARGMPSKENIVRRLNFCEWTEQVTRWLPMEAWDACEGLDLADLRGRRCVGGLDLGSTRDTTAFVLVFEEGDGLAVLPHFWLPEDGIAEREIRDHVPYREWARAGYLTITQGPVTDYREVRRRILELGSQYQVSAIAYDKWNATETAHELSDAGALMVDLPQRISSLAEAVNKIEAAVISGKLRHGGHPVLRWMAANASTKSDPEGNRRLIKPTDQTKRVDGMVALSMAVGYLVRAVPELPSVYDDVAARPEGLLSI